MKKLAFTIAVGLLLGMTPAGAADVQVIANSSIAATEISAAEVRDVFLGAKTSVAGGEVEPVLAKGGAAHEAFLKLYVGKSDQGLRNHFKSLVFTGKGAMPKSFATDADVVKYVATTKGAIGYVGAGAETAGVKTLAVK
jgi:ABC-type phosphate transport system substrate-binding protein